MTKKHFELIAGVFKNRAIAIDNSIANNESKHYALFEIRNTIYNLADEFELLNVNFDREKFIKFTEIEKYLSYYIVELLTN